MKTILSICITLIFSTLVKAQDVYEIGFTSGITRYRCALVLWSDGTGTMRVRYYKNNATRMVEQTMNLEKRTSGMIRLTGYNAVYPGTRIKMPNYSPDNFYIFQDEYGNVKCWNIDDNGDKSEAYIRLVTSYSNKQTFLSDFNWKL